MLEKIMTFCEKFHSFLTLLSDIHKIWKRIRSSIRTRRIFGIKKLRDCPIKIYYVSMKPKCDSEHHGYQPTNGISSEITVHCRKVISADDIRAIEDIRNLLISYDIPSEEKEETREIVQKYNDNIITIGLISQKMRQIIAELKLFTDDCDINRELRFRKIYRWKFFKNEDEEVDAKNYIFGGDNCPYDYGLIIKYHYAQYPNRVCICIGGLSNDGTHGAAYCLSNIDYYKKIPFYLRPRYLSKYSIFNYYNVANCVTIFKVKLGQYESAEVIAILVVVERKDERKIIEVYRKNETKVCVEENTIDRSSCQKYEVLCQTACQEKEHKPAIEEQGVYPTSQKNINESQNDNKILRQTANVNDNPSSEYNLGDDTMQMYRIPNENSNMIKTYTNNTNHFQDLGIVSTEIESEDKEWPFLDKQNFKIQQDLIKIKNQDHDDK